MRELGCEALFALIDTLKMALCFYKLSPVCFLAPYTLMIKAKMCSGYIDGMNQ